MEQDTIYSFTEYKILWEITNKGLEDYNTLLQIFSTGVI